MHRSYCAVKNGILLAASKKEGTMVGFRNPADESQKECSSIRLRRNHLANKEESIPSDTHNDINIR